MAFKSPSASSNSIFQVTDTATSGTVLYTFNIPSDVESCVAKIWLQGTWSASGTATIYIQTTEDGGTTWRDVSVTNIGASTVAASLNNTNAHFIPIFTQGGTDHGSSNYVGSVAASTLSAGASTAASAIGVASGLPFMSTLGRVQITYTATISTGGVNVQIFAPTGLIR